MKPGTTTESSANATGPTKTDARYSPSTINELLAVSVRAFPNVPAILAPDRACLTYAALGRQLDDTAHALAQAGYGGGSRIAVALPDGPESTVAVLAVCGCAKCAPLSPDLDEDALYRLIVAMRIDALIAPENADSSAVRAAREAGAAIIELRSSSPAPAGTFALAAPPGRSVVAVQPPDLDDIALVTHTSGTTSAPKIVPHTHRRIAEAARARVELGRVTRADRSLLMTPVSNLTSIRRVILPPLVMGGSVVCIADFDTARFIDWLEEFAPTHYMASVATQIAILEELERRLRPARHSLRFTLSGGASLPPNVQIRLERALGVPVIQAYGMTETGNIAQAPLPPERAPAGSAGRPTNVEIVIANETGGMLGVDELGEIMVRGPEIFDGYEDNPEANAAAFREGWFRTGDLGRIDRDGFLFLAGRIKDVINRGGAKVAPAEVENVLALHPQVAQAAAFALPHPTLGEDLAAAVVLRRDWSVSEDELREFARAHLAAFKIPTRIVMVAELPRGSFDKVKRAELALLAEEQLRQEFVPPRDPLEAAVAKIFAEVLDLERVGVLDNFFQLGGDSLRGMRAIAHVQSLFAVDIRIEAIFRQPTAAALAATIRTAQAAGTSMDPPPIAPTPRHVW